MMAIVRNNREDRDRNTNEINFKSAAQITGKRVYLNFKAMVNDLLTTSLILLLPTIICLSGIVIAPVKYNLGIFIIQSILIIEVITYGTVAGAFRRSTLNKNSNLTIGIRWIDNLATLLTMMIVSIIALGYVLFIITLFDMMGILIIDLSLRSSQLDYLVISSIDMFSLIYFSFLAGVITYSICYFFQGFFDSDIMFVTLGVILFVTVLIFGATINSYFSIRNSIDPRANDLDSSITYNKNVMTGQYMFIPSLMMPYYVPAQMMRISCEVMTNLNLDKYGVWTFFTKNNSQYLGAPIWKWNILWFVPYLHILFWWSSGFVYKNIIKW